METIEIRKEEDIVRARQMARNYAKDLDFSIIDLTRVATAVSELARNVYSHGHGGRMELNVIKVADKIGLRCIFIDEGPGIPDVEEAMSDGFSTGDGLGQGLPGSKRLMDNIKIDSKIGKGARVEVTKWK